MRKYVLTLSMFLATGTAYSLVVSDPGSYSRMAQQIQEAKELVKNAEAMVQQAQDIKNNLSGNLKRGRGIEDIIRSYKDDLEGMIPSLYHKLPEDIQNQISKELSNKLDEKIIYQKIDAELSDLTKDQRDDYRQKVLKRALLMSETTSKDMEASLNKMESLAFEIDQTQSMKDAMDLNNRLMHEMLLNQTKMVNLLAELTKAEATMNYQGTSSTSQPSQKLMPTDEYMLELGRGSNFWKIDETIGDIE